MPATVCSEFEKLQSEGVIARSTHMVAIVKACSCAGLHGRVCREAAEYLGGQRSEHATGQPLRVAQGEKGVVATATQARPAHGSADERPRRNPAGSLAVSISPLQNSIEQYMVGLLLRARPDCRGSAGAPLGVCNPHPAAVSPIGVKKAGSADFA